MSVNPLDAMVAMSRREKVHDDVMNVKMPATVKVLLKAEAERRGVTPAALVREAIGEYLTRKGY